MSAALAAPPVDVVDDAEFELDLRVVESATKLVITMCDTSDGCGSTCSTSACTTFSNDPF
ncbi:FxLD family lanthipeptide [Amycolatopsis sp. NBC_00438]|uniref:FxLD family lanthipeptide n=1 Tax=Amycolatopsis sp. NBC_00438 TaxID=2903558 RepID=UPI002E1F9731